MREPECPVCGDTGLVPDPSAPGELMPCPAGCGEPNEDYPAEPA